MISPPQCRAARALLSWSQQELAHAARVGVVTVRQFESGGTTPRAATLDVMKRALEAAGVTFISDQGRECVCIGSAAGGTEPAPGEGWGGSNDG